MLLISIHSLEGSRVVNLEKLQQFADDLTQHSTSCEGSITLNLENMAGLASTIKGDCSNCEHVITLDTSKKVKGPLGYNRWECNLAAVWGQMATETGHRQLEETMSVMEVPVMTKATFISTERDIGEWWKQILLLSMAKAGQEEKKIAEENGRFQWSKRSHKHSYNAKSGVALIIGKETRKLLFIGIRNKY